MSHRGVLAAALAIPAAAAVAATTAFGAGAEDTTVTIAPNTVIRSGAQPDRRPRRGRRPQGQARAGGLPDRRSAGHRPPRQPGRMRRDAPVLSAGHARTLATSGGIGGLLVGTCHSTYAMAVANCSAAVRPGETVTGTMYLVRR